jgi:putative Mn2+ efflux pump MntP
MPFFGYLLGAAFEEYIKAFDHWVAFGLLLVIGVGMLREAFSPDEDEGNNASFAPSVMLVMAIATSIDALAAGITFGVMPNVNLPLALGLIGGLTFCLSALGVKVGSVFGTRYRTAAQISGGVLLMLLGTKILLEHLGLLIL